MIEWIKRWWGAPLDATTQQAFRASLTATNRTRLRVMLPLMALLHVGHAILYRTPDNPMERALIAPDVLLWKDGVAFAHLATLPFTLVLALIVFTRGATWLGAACGLVYLLHGAACTAVDQLVVNNTTAYLGYALGLAVVIALTPLEALLLYAIGSSAALLSIAALQDNDSARMSALASVVTASLASTALSLFMHSARRRDFVQRRTIEQQRGELESLNAALEQRVQQQVQEIVKRADEVHALNQQLQARVRDRSDELSRTLQNIAQQRTTDGTLRKGTLLGERFMVGELLGRGGMGAVYAGVDQSNGASVAIKVIQAASARQLDALNRFLREARTNASVDHPAVVRALFIDVAADGLLFQVQERVDGITLEAVLARRGKLTLAEAARVGQVLCEGLDAAHAKAVVHRDVKPDNVMLTRTGVGLKLLDFGLAKLFEREPETPLPSDVTRAGFAVGTPAYMAPEQLEGRTDLIDRTDVYAVGVVLVRMLTGALPSLTVPLADVVPARALDVVTRALARSAAQRPSAREVAAALRSLADEENAPALADVDWHARAAGASDATGTTPDERLTQADRMRTPREPSRQPS